MARSSLIGSRIRERRTLKSMRQTDLAKSVGISPAYLNLIEHNRRRIGGKLLLDIAEVLEVEPALLSEGAEAALISALQQASADQAEIDVEKDRLEEFAGRFPGWAELLAKQSAEIVALKHGVEALNDRLSHDPFLSTALHEVISTVSSIQSSASILVDSTDIEKEWRERFQRNIFEDSQRLAETSQSLVGYLDPVEEDDMGHASPLEDLDHFLSNRGYGVDALERDEDADVGELLSGASELKTSAGRQVAENFLRNLQSIMQRAPAELVKSAEEQTDDPAQMALICGLSIEEMFQRLSFRRASEKSPQYGYLAVDASGALLAKKPIDGFNLPRLGGGCPLWPLFSAFSHPMTPLVSTIRQTGHDSEVMQAYSIAVPKGDLSFSRQPRYTAHMLLRPAIGEQEAPDIVGVNCRICPVNDCAARREISILSDGF